MSKAIKSVASIALPIIGTMIAPGIGTALGSTLSAGATGAIGGALGGAAGGLVSGGGLKGALKGAALGGAGGYISGSGGFANAASNLGMGTLPGSPIAGTIGPQLASASPGTGLAGALSSAGTGVSNLVGGAAKAVGLGGGSGGGSGYLGPLTTAGNVISAVTGSNTALDAAKIQANAAAKARAENTAINKPYTDLGRDATNQIRAIQSNPGAYVQSNPFYSSLAADAERRLLANQAAKGKVGSGGTAAALQEQLLNLGNSLVQQQVGTLQSQANLGANAAAGVGTNNANLTQSQGASTAAGQVGSYGAYKDAYQNQINTLLALKGINRTPTYAPQQLNA